MADETSTRTDPTYWTRKEPLYPLFLPGIDLLSRLLFDVEVSGEHNLPRRGPVLLAANHVSFLDPCVLAVVAHRLGRRLRFVALADLFEVPGLGWLLRKGRMIPVARGRGAEQMTREVCAALSAGQAVLVYPEGTIPPPGSDATPKRGAGLVALSTSAPVVPVGTWGLERRRGRMPPLRRRVAVVFGAPLDLAGLGDGRDRVTQRAAAEAMLAAVRAHADEARRAAARRK
jgi:1-acyl-sn-glycerol-3-phosphate acyltransferase